jgi:hypothetical protein
MPTFVSFARHLRAAQFPSAFFWEVADAGFALPPKAFITGPTNHWSSGQTLRV